MDKIKKDIIMKIEKLKEEYIEQLINLQLKNNYKDLSKEEKLKRKCNNINFFKEILHMNDKQVIIAIDDNKILGAGIIHFVNIDKSSSISMLIDNMKENIIDSLVKKMKELSKEKNVNEIFFISQDDKEINKIFSKNGFNCIDKTFRCKLTKDTKIDKNANIERITNKVESDLPDYIEKIVNEPNKIILEYKQNGKKEYIVSGMPSKKEIQIYIKPRPDDIEIEKQLIKEIQRLAVEKGIYNLCSIEINVSNKKEEMLKNLGFIPTMFYYVYKF